MQIADQSSRSQNTSHAGSLEARGRRPPPGCGTTRQALRHRLAKGTSIETSSVSVLRLNSWT
jgi:hypothetical protein